MPLKKVFMKTQITTCQEISGALFRADWYQSQAPNVLYEDAVFHYLTIGWKYLLSPHPLFSPDYYLGNCYPYIECASEPVEHFLTTAPGKFVSPHPDFDIDFYEWQLSASGDYGRNPLVHYLTTGWKSGFRPNRGFDPAWYIARYSDVAAAGTEPLTHFLMRGRHEGRAAAPASLRSSRGLRRLSTQTSFVGPSFAFQESAQQDTRISIYIHIPDVDYADRIASLLAKLTIPYTACVMTSSLIERERVEVDFLRYGLNDHIEYAIAIAEDATLAPFLVDGGEPVSCDICLKLTGYNPADLSTLSKSAMDRIQDDMLADPAQVHAIVAAFQASSALGLVLPQYSSDLLSDPYASRNVNGLRPMLNTLEADIDGDNFLDFAGGGMFWFRASALALNSIQKTALKAEARRHLRDVDNSGRLLEPMAPLVCCLNGLQWTFAPRAYDRYRLPDDEQVEHVRRSGLFDESFYCATYADVAMAGVDPVRHWTLTGFKEGRDPSPTFSTRYYNQSRRLSADAHVNPIIHLTVSGEPKSNLSGNEPHRRMPSMSFNVGDTYRNVYESKTYSGETFPLLRSGSVKVLAFYLPQFHPFPENDKFWGKGFTEWTNTSKARPMFDSHHQPRLPGELGFYDTRLKETLVRQAQLARQYGVYGFCLHHYFFSGKAVMRAPFDIILANPDIDLKFCLHWANEPWTVRFDGLSDQKGVLLEQRHEPDDDIAFFRDIEPALRDPRYIHVDGRPLLIIYRPALFPDMKATIERWKLCCIEAGLPRLYCATMHTVFEGEIDPTSYGLDAAVEFPPHMTNVPNVVDRVELYDAELSAGLYDYVSVMDQSLAKAVPDYPFFRGAMLEWDCSARRAAFGAYINYSPERYEKWLTGLCKQATEGRPGAERLVFVNAWNEWAEGTYLEPDRRFGYAALQATANALNAYPRSVDPSRPKQRILIIMHIFYAELTEEMLSYLHNVTRDFDLLITAPAPEIEMIRSLVTRAAIACCRKVILSPVDNFGFDIAPFVMKALPIALEYDVCCKVHAKRTPYNNKFKWWRQYLLKNMLGSSANVMAILETFAERPDVGLVYPHPYKPVVEHMEWGSNFANAFRMARALGIRLDMEDPLSFPTGSMFWFRPRALKALLQLDLDASDFGPPRHDTAKYSDSFVTDGSTAHAIERMFEIVSKAADYRSVQFSFFNKGPFPAEDALAH